MSTKTMNLLNVMRNYGYPFHTIEHLELEDFLHKLRNIRFYAELELLNDLNLKAKEYYEAKNILLGHMDALVKYEDFLAARNKKLKKLKAEL
jgi:cobalamin biosynthesis Mg chelatase CobN